MSQRNYHSDLSDEEWRRIASLLPPQKPVGKLREVSLRKVLNAIFYRADNGTNLRSADGS
jgi:transposase